jgi:hypothetical protein
VFDGKVLLPVVGKRLVKRAVLVARDLGGVARPDRLCLVELLGLLLDLLDLLGLLGFLLLVFDLFDLRVVFVFLLLLIVLDLLHEDISKYIHKL